MPATIPNGIHSPRLHAVLYSLLLVATPFVLLQNFLVEKISEVSATTVSIGGHDLPVLPLIAIALVAILLIAVRRHLTRLRLAAGVVVVLMIALAQQITDYYFGHHFYDLQQNWHYIAYGLFAYMVYRDLAPRGMPPAKIVLVTYLMALAFSAFDETFQMYMSSRVFDVCDIAKDVWGTLMGIVFIYLVTHDWSQLRTELRKIRQRRVRDYFTHVPSILVLELTFGALFVVIGSLLTDFEYWPYAVLITVSVFALFFFVLHFSQRRAVRQAVITLIIVAVLVQATAFIAYRSDQITYTARGLTVYKGIPLIYFDVLIFPDGTFRPVDKKHYFNYRDQAFLQRQGTDIIIVSSGSQGNGGRGFATDDPVQFAFNPALQRATQIIILPNGQACELFNRLKAEGKSVLFVLHNTC